MWRVSSKNSARRDVWKLSPCEKQGSLRRPRRNLAGKPLKSQQHKQAPRLRWSVQRGDCHEVKNCRRGRNLGVFRHRVPGLGGMVTLTYTGTVADGFDQLGIFGTPNASLTGDRYTAVFTFTNRLKALSIEPRRACDVARRGVPDGGGNRPGQTSGPREHASEQTPEQQP